MTRLWSLTDRQRGWPQVNGRRDILRAEFMAAMYWQILARASSGGVTFSFAWVR